MNRNAALAAIAVIAVISVAGVGYALADYTGIIHSTSNVTYDGYSIDIYDRSGDAAISQNITFSLPSSSVTVVDETQTLTVHQSTVNIESYKIVLNRNMNVTAMIVLDDVSSWWFIDSITVTVYSDAACYNPKASESWSPGSVLASSHIYDSQAYSYTSEAENFSNTVSLGELIYTEANYLKISVTYKEKTIDAYTSEFGGNYSFALSGKLVFVGQPVASP